MKYDVYLGSATIYGVSEVEVSAGRALNTYNGLGQGNFLVGGDKELRKFGLSCELTEQNPQNSKDWSPAVSLIANFEQMLGQSESMRLIIVSDYCEESVPVLLESYSKTEKYAGVYEVSLKLIEHREYGVRTANVPYIPRAGKIPPIMQDKLAAIHPPKEDSDTDSKIPPELTTANDGERLIDIPNNYDSMKKLRKWHRRERYKRILKAMNKTLQYSWQT